MYFKEYVSELLLKKPIWNNICLIFEKFNELKWNAFLKEKNTAFRSKEINWKAL